MNTLGRAAAVVVVCCVAAAGCKEAGQPAPRLGGPGTPSPSADPSPAAAATSASGGTATLAWAVPPLGIKTPLPGEPDVAALAAARLVTNTCQDHEDDVRARVETMRAAVEGQFSDWKTAPRCDELYGIGEGGGGRGEGIGLGSIGTLGHGAGVGAGTGVGGASSYSRTNNQVDGVDEADIVKTDGKYVYLATHGALRIVEAMHPRLLSVTGLGGEVRDILLEGDRAVAFVARGASPDHPCTYSYDCSVGGDGSHTSVVVVDVADRSRPRIARRVELSGSLIAARRIGNTVHTVVADGDAPPDAEYETWPEEIPQCRVKGMDPAAVHARFRVLARENERKIRASAGFPTITEGGAKRELCAIMHTPLADGRAFTTVLSFDMRDDKTAPVAATLQSRPGVVFASERALYLSVPHRRRGTASRWYSFYPSIDEVSDIHQFSIGASPDATRYVGSGVVPGHVLNQFAMDEWYGYLRVATTRGRVPSPDADSAVSVLADADGGNLVRVGAVEHIAPGEDIRAVRFDGDRGYVVTFKKTDPLFVVDLGNPASPRVLGELKIPGFSTYLHRIDPTHLLSIGFDANDHGSFAYFDGIILQLFDVTDPTAPVLLHKEKIGTRGSSSAAATDHLAFNYFGERNLLAVPMTVCEGGGDGEFGRDLAFSGLYVYEVTLEGGFKRLGGVDHGKKGASCSQWWSSATSLVQRSIFMDDLVYSIAPDRLKVQRLDALGKDVGDIALGP